MPGRSSRLDSAIRVRPTSTGGLYGHAAHRGPAGGIISQPSATGDVSVSPDPVAASLVVPVPVVTVEVLLAPAPVAISIVVPSSSVTAGRVVAPDSVPIPLVVPAPTVTAASGTSDVTITPSPVTAPLVVPAPSVTVGILIGSDPVIILLVLPQPVVTANIIGGPPPSIIPGGGGGGARQLLPRGKPFRERREPVPEVVARSLMDNLVREYGIVHGREVYFAMQREMKGPFAPGNKYDVTQRPQADVEPAHPIERVPAARKN